MSKHPNLPALLSFLVGIAYRLERLDQAHFLPLLDLPNDSVRYLTNMVEAVLCATSKDQWAHKFAAALLEDAPRLFQPVRDEEYREWFLVVDGEMSEHPHIRLKTEDFVFEVAEAIYQKHSQCINACVGEILKTPDMGLVPATVLV